MNFRVEQRLARAWRACVVDSFHPLALIPTLKSSQTRFRPQIFSYVCFNIYTLYLYVIRRSSSRQVAYSCSRTSQGMKPPLRLLLLHHWLVVSVHETFYILLLLHCCPFAPFLLLSMFFILRLHPPNGNHPLNLWLTVIASCLLLVYLLIFIYFFFFQLWARRSYCVI